MLCLLLGINPWAADHSLLFGCGFSSLLLRDYCRIVVVVCACFVILPLSLQRDMSSLSNTSLVSITADAVIVVILLVRGPVVSRGARHACSPLPSAPRCRRRRRRRSTL